MKKSLLIGLILAIVILPWFVATLIHLCSDRDNFRFRSYFQPRFYSKQLKRNEEGFTTENKRILGDNKLLTMSIYGNNKKYYDGLKERIKEYKKLLPDWRVRVYYHNRIDSSYKQFLLDQKEIELVEVSDPLVKPGNSSGMFWRLMPLIENKTFISCDVDNEPLIEPKMVKEWLNSKSKILKRTPWKNANIWPVNYIQGSMFGCKSKSEFKLEEIANYPCRSPFGSDELFLYFVVVDKFKNEETMVQCASKIDKILSQMCMFIPVKDYSIKNKFEYV